MVLAPVSITSAVAGRFYIVPLSSAPPSASASALASIGSPAPGSMFAPWSAVYSAPPPCALASVVQPLKLPSSMEFDGAALPPFDGAINTAGQWFAIVQAFAPGPIACAVVG